MFGADGRREIPEEVTRTRGETRHRMVPLSIRRAVRNGSRHSMATHIRVEPQRAGEHGSLDRLMPLVYEELRGIAHRRLSGCGRGATLTTTGVVHEMYLKLVDQTHPTATDRAHFMAIASLAMRQILIDRARARVALKRGGARQCVTLEEDKVSAEEQPGALIELDAALQRLAEFSPRLARVVELRFFGGMSEEEIASALGLTVRTVQRDWSKARMLLRHELTA
jgi:RNA polymerase sigma factor (TIGR02999 family)